MGPIVTDQHVEPAELRDRPVRQALEVLGPGDVRGAGDGASATVADLLGELVETLRPARAEDDGRAALPEHARRSIPDATARPGDGDDLAADAAHGNPFT